MTAEVTELQPFNAAMSKRAEQVARNLAHFEKEWRAAHPDQEPGPAAMSRLTAMAWDHERPHKKPTSSAARMRGDASSRHPAIDLISSACRRNGASRSMS